MYLKKGNVSTILFFCLQIVHGLLFCNILERSCFLFSAKFGFIVSNILNISVLLFHIQISYRCIKQFMSFINIHVVIILCHTEIPLSYRRIS